MKSPGSRSKACSRRAPVRNRPRARGGVEGRFAVGVDVGGAPQPGWHPGQPHEDPLGADHLGADRGQADHAARTDATRELGLLEKPDLCARSMGGAGDIGVVLGPPVFLRVTSDDQEQVDVAVVHHDIGGLGGDIEEVAGLQLEDLLEAPTGETPAPSRGDIESRFTVGVRRAELLRPGGTRASPMEIPWEPTISAQIAAEWTMPPEAMPPASWARLRARISAPIFAPTP